MRDDARAVVIGGGVGGCSILYHLAKLGWKDVVLVEQYGLTHGSTWHSAGLVGQLRSTVSLTKMMQYSVGLYADLARETGKDPGWHELGGLRLASSQERYEEIQRQAGWAKSFGLPIEIVSPAEAKELFPPMSTDGVAVGSMSGRLRYLLKSPDAFDCSASKPRDISSGKYSFVIPISFRYVLPENVIELRCCAFQPNRPIRSRPVETSTIGAARPRIPSPFRSSGSSRAMI